MRCPGCELTVDVEDNYCRQCGTTLNVINLPAVIQDSRAMSVWEETKPAVVRGVMVLVAGAVFRFAVRRAGRAAVSALIDPAEGGLFPRRLMPFKGNEPSTRNGADEIEVLWYRRVRR